MLMGFLGFCRVLQVGSYFVGQYYQVLQQNPDLVHQFYSEASTMIRVDADSSDTASAMLVISFWENYTVQIYICMYMCFYVYECVYVHYILCT